LVSPPKVIEGVTIPAPVPSIVNTPLETWRSELGRVVLMPTFPAWLMVILTSPEEVVEEVANSRFARWSPPVKVDSARLLMYAFLLAPSEDES
jgi:hypothetical protein